MGRVHLQTFHGMCAVVLFLKELLYIFFMFVIVNKSSLDI